MLTKQRIAMLALFIALGFLAIPFNPLMLLFVILGYFAGISNIYVLCVISSVAMWGVYSLFERRL